jgi:hypothetical protein
MFRDSRGVPGRQKDCKPELFLLIEVVILNNESLPERLLPKGTIVHMEHGSRKSGQRGHVTHATNEGVLEKDVERLARWRSVMNAGRKQANVGGKMESHSDVMHVLKMLLKAARDL